MKREFSVNALALFVTMLILGLVFALVYHEIVMPLTAGDLLHCIAMGELFGLLNFLIALMFFKRYTRLKKANRRLELDILTDKLTGLLNRRALENDLEAPEQAQVSSCVFIDIDNFRDFNNRFGHEVGDQILRKVALAIKNEVRQEDRVYRYGGEEIVVFLVNCNNINALFIAEKIRLKVGSIRHKNHQITLSIGVSSYPKDGKNIKAIVEGADMAMLIAKQQGKNRTVIC